jgi:phage terminase small subunit
MPRKSRASLSVVPLDSRNVRLRPPANLPQPERDLFVALVASNAPAHFKESDMPLLVQYCAAAVLSERAVAELRAAPLDGGRPSPWLTVFEKASRTMLGLSMRLRLSPQARQANNPTRPTPRLSAYEMEALRDAET